MGQTAKFRKRDERTYELELSEFETPEPLSDYSILEPQATEAPVVTSVVAANNQPAPLASSGITTALPYELTEALLKQWKIPEQYWTDLLSV